jgi:glutaredoxin
MAYRPALSATADSEPRLAQAESVRTAAAPPGAELAEGAHQSPVLDGSGEPMQDQTSEPAESTAVTTVNIAELERAREQAQRAEQQLDAARSGVKVTLYSSERCTRCIEARSHLLAQGIHPTVRDIDKDARARARHRALTRRGGLPTIEVDGKVLMGFQPERLDKAIARAATVRMQRKR